MKYVDIEPLTKEIDSLYDEWCGSSTGLEVGEEGASIGAAESIFEEVRKIIESLQQERPSLPSNLNEAAIDAAQLDMQDRQIMEATNEERLRYSRIFRRGFKAGAEWLAGRGVSMLGKVGIYGVDVETITEELRDAGFRLGEEVILQIRKKQ